MSNQGFGAPGLEQTAAKNHRLSFQVVLQGNTTLASTTAAAFGPGADVQVWTQVNSATAPADANFASLVSNATPTVIGIYIPCAPFVTLGTTTSPAGNAVRLHQVTVDANSIRSASMTAAVVTYKGSVSAITGNEGVTASSGAIAFQLSCTTLKLTDAANTHRFSVNVDYDVI